MKQFLIALQFLTILPLKAIQVSEKDMARSAAFFVLVGGLQGIIMIAALTVAEKTFQFDLALFFTLVVYVILNGGFHLDGLADTFDALAVKSKGDGDKDMEFRLSVMKDGSAGPSGVLAIFSVMLMKFFALKNISNFIPSLYYLSFLLMPILSKWTMVAAIFHGTPARTEGLGAIFLKHSGKREFLISTFMLFAFYALIYILFYHYLPGGITGFYILSAAILYGITHFWISFCKKRFGGLTGDTLGALHEITEILFLLMVIIWQRLSF